VRSEARTWRSFRRAAQSADDVVTSRIHWAGKQ
jgi:hypothetical protein